jgi:hypothetical protein
LRANGDPRLYYPDEGKVEGTRMKTTETTEEVSSHPEGKGIGSAKSHRNTPCVRENPRADRKKDLQICGAGRK